MVTMTLGLDIGGANIKAADVTGCAISRPFAIWRHPEQLATELLSILREFTAPDRFAVTMTAELADCYATKAEGVRSILKAVQAAIAMLPQRTKMSGTGTMSTFSADVVVWTTAGTFVNPDVAHERPLEVAAANWHALATWCGQLAPSGAALLIDIGSTTTDFIPLLNGAPIPQGKTDVARLQSGELAYSGIRRTPLCAIAHSVPFRAGYCSLSAELFATTLDLYLLLGQIGEDANDRETANGQPATKSAAHDRIARMLCGDRTEVTFAEAVDIARFLADVQRRRLAGSMERVLQRFSVPCETVLVSGSGTFLARQLVNESRHTKNARVISLAEQLSPELAEAACAHAVAQLANACQL